MSEELGEKERIQILLTEYASLRAEINARISSIYQVAAIIALITTWLEPNTWRSLLHSL